jgi:tetratricopeptide (TPR) repeat protein
VSFSNRLGDLGRREEALAAIEEAVTIRRQLAGARPDAFLPDLAMALNNQSIRVGDLGRQEEALAAVEEAVTIYRQLAGARPAAFLADLTTSLYNLANILSLLNRGAEASAIRNEAGAARGATVQAPAESADDNADV